MKIYPMKRLLVCTDLSESSDLLLKTAHELQQRNGGSIDLLYVSELGLHIEETFEKGLKQTYREVFLKDLKDSLESKLKSQLSRCGSDAKIICRDGRPGDVIVELANEGNHDLIIMGHGKRPVLQRLLGSNAFKVISATPIPLLIVKCRPSFERMAALIDESHRPMDRIIIGAFNFFQNFKYGAIEFISLWMDFPSPFGAGESGKTVKSRIESEVAYFSPEGVNSVVKVSPTKELKVATPLEKILDEAKVDLIVLKKFGEVNLKRIHIGSTTKQLVETFPGNSLIFPP